VRKPGSVAAVIVKEPDEGGWHAPSLVQTEPVRGSQGPVLCWQFTRLLRSISSAIVGGGIGTTSWVLNLSVPSDYARYDPQNHIAEVADQLALAGAGIGLLTAVDVREHSIASCDGAVVCATVGVRRPVWAYNPQEPLPSLETKTQPGAINPGTINLVCYVNERLSDAALVNAVATVTEAKTQALADRLVAGTGTASDAVAVLCPEEILRDQAIFCGSRSYWGARLAMATYEAVTLGIDRQRQ
jgi:adenosylcobinamide hydrolase